MPRGPSQPLWLLVAGALGGVVVALVRPPKTASDIDEALRAGADLTTEGRAGLAAADFF